MANPAATPRPRFLAPGDKLGKYDLIRQIAVGGMAELYLARTVGIEGFEKLVVIKRILPQFGTNASFVNMFLNEARLAATLHHPNIAQVYDIGQEGSEYFFAMEYIHGEDLGRMVASAADSGVPISLDVALTLVAGLCAGLHYAHEKSGSDGKALNVVHRDVSPSNVLVSYDGAVKLVDFGIARAGSQPSTTRGGIKGKIGYMSPEQCKGKETLDRRSDIFSVGAIMFELTTGRQPFMDETEYGVLNQIVNTDALPPSRFVPSYPAALDKIVMKALARERDQRYASAIELQGDIEDFAHENRLRISPLVLARLMGALFPARLEEWDHARAQGAFFVEQHVVRTLIESGKSTESGVALGSLGGDEDTSISPPPLGDNEPTTVQGTAHLPETQPLPVSTRAASARTPQPLPLPPAPRPVTPVPHQVTAAPQHIRQTPVPRMMTPTAPTLAAPPMQQQQPQRAPGSTRIPSPVPGMPGAVPIITPGTLVSSAGSFGAPMTPMPPVGDVTDRVRVPASHANETAMLQIAPRSKAPIIMVAVAGAIGVIVATVIVLSGGKAPESNAPSKIEMKTELPKPEPKVDPPKEDEAPTPTEVAKEAPKPAEAVKETPKPAEVVTEAPKPAEVVKEAPKVEPKPKKTVAKVEPKPKRVEAKKVEPKKVEPKKVEPKKVEPKVEARVEPKTEPKPEPKTEPKPEPKYNADSPFMPVRPPEKK